MVHNNNKVACPLLRLLLRLNFVSGIKVKSLALTPIFVFVFSVSAFGATRTVCATGADHTTIQAAMTVAVAGDIISICDGTYNENNLVITKNDLIIQGQSGNRENVIIQNSTSDKPVLTATTYISNFTLKNLTINQTRNNQHAVYINNGGTGYLFDNIKIISTNGHAFYQKNGTFQNSSFTNVDFNASVNSFNSESPQNLTLKDVNLSSSGNSCFTTNTPTGSITLTTLNQPYNLLTCNNTGIILGNSSQNYTISHTKITTTANNAAAVSASTINVLTMDDVQINSSDQGSGIYVNGDVNTAIIKNSTFSNIKNEAIYFSKLNSSGSLFEGNSINDGSYGIRLKDFSNLVTIKNNIIRNISSYGILLLNSSEWRGSNVINNCFINNVNNAISKDQDAHFDDGSSGNYWDDWSGSGSYTVPNIPKYDAYPLAQCPLIVASVPTPIVDYRFDECAWDGSAGEVNDSSGGDQSATRQNNANIGEGGVINNYGDFNGTRHLIPLSANIDLTGDYTVALWVKFPLSNLDHQTISGKNYYAVGSVAGRGDLGYFWTDKANVNTVGWGIYGTTGNAYNSASLGAISAGWHHIAFVKNSSGTSFYLDSVNKGSTDKKTNGIVNYLLTSADNPSGQTLGTYADEFKIYNVSLPWNQIRSIYTNESAKKNYDGTSRNAITCGFSTCFTDDFSRTDLGSKWSIIKAENYTPNISANKLMLTKNSSNIASGVSLVGDFPSADNLIEIELEHNAYGGNGADGVVVVLSDANITPVAGAYGGSLGYANRTGYSGFAGGWLGFGLDEFGNFSNPTEGRNGGPGFRTDAFAIRGSGSGQTGYNYIAGTTTLSPGIDNASSSTPAPGHKYKLTIDTRNNQTIVSVARDINNSGVYTSILTDANATQAASAPSKYKLSFTGSTGGSNNYHSFDNLSIKALQCGTLGQDKNITSNFFDAWDTTGDIATRAIQTKIVKKDFTLNVVGLNTANTAYQDFNGTLCARLVDSSDRNLTGWNKLLFTGANLQTTTFNSSYASKDSRVALSWKKNIDTTCPISVEDNNTKSTDHFAIRPNKFTIANATMAYAGDSFTLDFKALNNSNGNSLDYNETKDGSFAVTSVIGKNGCSNGTFNVSNFSFIDGQKLVVDSNYSDVGDINITIAERTNFEFAKIDASDTSSANRLITPATLVVTVNPYELNITDANFTASTVKTWLYDANVSDMYVSAHATVQANNKQHVALQNFTSSCYAQPVDLSFYYDANNTNANVNLSYAMTSGTMASALKSISDINKTITLPASLFTTSSASADYRFNIDRAYNVPLSPIDISLRDVKVTSLAVAKNENNATVNKAARFYYGRIKTKDIVTDKTIAPHLLHVEVYSPTAISGFYQNTLNWYINADDDGTTVLSDGNFSENKAFLNNQPSTSVGVSGTTSFIDGISRFNINNILEEKGSVVHLGIPTWLWNSTLSDYNNSVGATCVSHPCFDYKYIKDKDTVGIKSGTFKGSTIGNDYNATYQKSGVKTFR